MEVTHDKLKLIFDLIGFETTDEDLLQIFCDFANIVTEFEREECADMVSKWSPEFWENMTQSYAAKYIRERKKL